MMPAGRRPLRSTVYLEIALRELPVDCPPTPREQPHLYAAWRELHRRVCGYDLVEPKRSFRAAVAVARRRIEKGRNE